jgi:peroxiredoxin Q/BCP
LRTSELTSILHEKSRARPAVDPQFKVPATGAPMVTTGKKVANFSIPATGGKTISLSDFAGTNLVIYFYPKDNTPGCTREGQEFRDSYQQFQDAGCDILGVSRDSVKSHDNFCQKHGFPFDLLSDTDELLCKQFDVIHEKNMYGRKVMGVVRSTFLIDGDGILREEWRKVRVPGHVEAVLEAARNLDPKS